MKRKICRQLSMLMIVMVFFGGVYNPVYADINNNAPVMYANIGGEHDSSAENEPAAQEAIPMQEFNESMDTVDVALTATPSDYKPDKPSQDRDKEKIEYAVDNGSIYINPKNGYITSADKSITAADIPDSVDGIDIVGIDKYAFSYCKNLSTVKLPESMKKLGAYCFENSGIREIEIPSAVTETATNFGLGGKWFNGCKNLEEITLEEGTTAILPGAFSGIKSEFVIHIPDSVKTIGNHAFSGSSIRKVTSDVNYKDKPGILVITKNIETLGTNVFDYCDRLTEVEWPEHMDNIPAYTFRSTGSLDSVSIGNNVKKLGVYCFADSGIKSIEIPASVIETDNYFGLGGRWFDGCNNLEEITLADGTSAILSGAFSGIKSEFVIHIPDSVETIEKYAFANSSLTKISDNADDASTKGILVLPPKVDTISSYSFSYCSQLIDVKIREGIKKIGAHCFENSGIKNIEIPASVIETDNYFGLGGRWFDGCNNLEEITLADGTSAILSGAFSGIKSEFVIHIPDSVKSIGNYAFYGSSIKKVTSDTSFKNTPGIFVIEKNIEVLGKNIFDSCENLTEVIWPEHINNIPAYTFQGTDSLSSVSIGNGVSQLGVGCFANSGIEEIEIPASITSAGDYFGLGGRWFHQCDKLKKIIVEEGTTTILTGAFSGIKSDYTIEMPDTIKKIEDKAFFNCSNLSKLEIPPNVTFVGKEAFSNCPKLLIRTPFNYPLLQYLFDNTDLKYEIIVGNMKMNSGILDTEVSKYEIQNVNEIGYINCSLDYSIEKTDFDNISDAAIRVRIQDSVDIERESIKLNSIKVENYTIRDGILSVPIEKDKGHLEFALKRNAYEEILSYASINYTVDEARKDDLVGYIKEDVRAAFIDDIPVHGPRFNVEGISTPDSKVRIYLDEKLVGTKITDAKGRYKIIASTDGSDIKVCSLSVKTGGSAKEASSKIIYNPKHPEIESFLLNYQNAAAGKEEIELLDTDVKKQTIAVHSRSPLIYSLNLSNDATVDRVFVHARDFGPTEKVIEAYKDEGSGRWVTRDYFDDKNTNYMPSKVWVTYTTAMQKTTLANGHGILVDRIKNAPQEEIDQKVKDIELRLLKNEIINLGDAGVQLGLLKGDETLIQKWNDIKGGFEFIIDIPDFDKINKTMHNWEEATEEEKRECIKLLLNKSQHASKLVSEIEWPLRIFLIILNEELDLMYYINDELQAVIDDLDAVQASLAAGNSVNAETIAKIDDAQKRINRFLYALDTIKEETAAEIERRKAGDGNPPSDSNPGNPPESGELKNPDDDQKTGPESDMPKGRIDPSGYIYEAVTTNRLSEVKVSIYQFDEISYLPLIWDAAAYGQQNPQMTTEAGIFGWDVPAGKWQVRCERDGYPAYISEWMVTPPEHTDVKIPMVSMEKPEIVDISRDRQRIGISFSKYMKPETLQNITILDIEGNTIPYSIDYSKNEKDKDNIIFAKDFTINISENKEMPLMVQFDTGIKSYSDVSMDSCEKIVP